MNIFIRAFRLILRIITQIYQVIDLLGMIEKHLARQPDPTSKSKWLDNQEAMQMLKASERTLRRRRHDGTLQFSLMKRKFYYLESDIEKMLKRKSTKIPRK